MKRYAPTAVLALTLIACAGGSGARPSTDPTSTSSSATTTPTPQTTAGPGTTTTAGPATSTTTQSSPLEGQVIVIDPGHNGMNWAFPEEINRQVDIGTGTKACNTTGTTSADGYAEPTFTWAVAKLTVSLLESLGATVVLTREDNDGWGPCITERAAVGNEVGADAVVSIHADGGPDSGRGFHVIYPAVVDGLTDDIAEESFRLAEALHTAYRSTGMPIADYVADAGYSEREDLGGLTLSDVPVVFLEAGNMRNTEDISLLQDPSFQMQIAESIARALVAYLTLDPGP